MSKFAILFCLAFIILFTNITKAQSTKQFLPDTAKHFEVGINTIPAITFALNAEADQNYVLSFRKQHNKSAFQIKGIFYQEFDNYDYFEKLTLKDSVVTVNGKYHNPEKYFGVAVGMEFYNPAKKLRWYWGFDLLLSYYINSNGQATYSYLSDTVNYPSPHNNERTYLSSGTIEIYQWGGGAGIKGGLRIPLSNHFFLQTEGHIHFIYLFKGSYKIYGDEANLIKTSYNGFNLYSEALIPEVTLFYRF